MAIMAMQPGDRLRRARSLAGIGIVLRAPTISGRPLGLSIGPFAPSRIAAPYVPQQDPAWFSFRSSDAWTDEHDVDAEADDAADAIHEKPVGFKKARTILAGRLNSLHRKTVKSGESFGSLAVGERHKVRKQLERLRDLAEFVGPLFDADAAARCLERPTRARHALGEQSPFPHGRKPRSRIGCGFVFQRPPPLGFPGCFGIFATIAPMTASTDSFVRRVRGHLEALPDTERKLANFVLEFPGELAGYAGNELAELAGVSPSTVSRFIRRIGYETYEEARRHVREEKQSGSPLFQSSSAGRGGKDGELVRAQARVSAANLSTTFERLTDTQIVDIAKAILRAERVLVFGSRSSHGFAVYLRWQIIQVVANVTAIPGAGETLGEHLAGIGERDCVIVFGIRRQTRQMNAVLDAASRARAKILFVSDQTSPDYPGATWSVQCDCRGTGLLDNHVAVMALCDLIATTVVDASGSAGRRRLAAIEQAHDDFDEL
jgi:DNA-binding MurR/RpiR family transcriptional regulator